MWQQFKKLFGLGQSADEETQPTITTDYDESDVDVDDVPQESIPDVGQQVTDLVKPLIASGEYHQYKEKWAEDGFYIRPNIFAADRAAFGEAHLDAANTTFMPSLFVLGAAKSGTSTVHEYLSQVPEICMSYYKEPYYFECEYELGLDFYREKYFFHWAGQKIIGESRHRNLYLSYVPERIYATNPAAKLLVMVREPIMRAYSHWWYWHSRDMDPLSFEECVRLDLHRLEAGEALDIDRYCDDSDISGKGIYRTYVDSGHYAEQIERYLQLFPAEQLKIMFMEDLSADPFAFVQELQDFVGVSYYTAENFEVIHANEVKEDEVERPPLDPQTRAWLSAHFVRHNEHLARLTGRDLSHWDQ